MIPVKKNAAYYHAFPAITIANPELYAVGETPLDSAYYKDGAGLWTALTIADSAVEIGASGMYEIDFSAAEFNHDYILIKFTGTGMADDAYLFVTSLKLIDDLNDFDADVDVVARVTLVDTVETVMNIVNVTNIASSAAQACEVYDAIQPYRPGVAAIVLNVRDSLADPDGDRYSTARLVRLIDKAQKDLNIRAKLLRNKITMELSAGNSAFSLPVNTRNMTRVVGFNGTIDIISHSQADEKYGVTWETDTGNSIEAIVYDKQNAVAFKIYPIQKVSTGDDTIYTYDFADYGFLYDIEDYTPSTDYGVITAISDVSPTTIATESDYGIITHFREVPDSLRITMYTLVNCDTLEYAIDDDDGDVFSPLQLQETYDIIIEHYVVGMAFRDDIDTQNRALAKEHLDMYADLAQAAIFDSAKNHVEGSDVARAKPKYTSGV